MTFKDEDIFEGYWDEIKEKSMPPEDPHVFPYSRNPSEWKYLGDGAWRRKKLKKN